MGRPHLSAIVLALLVGGALIALMGINPLRAYAALLDGALGNRNSIAETLMRSVPLALAGIGISIAFQAGVFNVGAEGQLYLGGMAAAWVGLQWADLPLYRCSMLMIVAAMVVGGLWAGVAAFLKVRFQSSELINTIMLNYIAIFLVSYLVHGPLQEPGSPLGQTARLSPSATLPVILPATRLHAGLLLAIVVAVVAYAAAVAHHLGFSHPGRRQESHGGAQRGHQRHLVYRFGVPAQRRAGGVGRLHRSSRRAAPHDRESLARLRLHRHRRGAARPIEPDRRARLGHSLCCAPGGRQHHGISRRRAEFRGDHCPVPDRDLHHRPRRL